MGDLQLKLGRTDGGREAGDGAGSGLPSFCKWPQPIATSARIVARAPGPAFLLIGPDGLLFANPAGHVALGQPLDGSANARAISDVAPEQADAFAGVLKQASRGEGSRLRNLEVHSERDGAPVSRWLDIDVIPVVDAAGFTLGVMCMASDVTQSQIRFDTLTESLPQIVWSSDAEGRHDYFSRRWTEFTGIEPHEIGEHTRKELVHPEDWERVCGAWEEARRSGQPYDIDYRFLHHSGEYRWLRVMALPVCDGRGIITRWCGTSTDVHEDYLVSEERQRLAYELERIANFDQLTDVLTRRAFFECADDVLRKPTGGVETVSVLMVDVDHFKQINDRYGHPAGDAVLSLAAKRMGGAIKESDLLGRLGGEEFALLLPGCSSEGGLATAERLRCAIEATPFALDGGERIWVTVSIGVTSGPASAGDLQRLISVADKALYRAKSGGRNRSVGLEA